MENDCNVPVDEFVNGMTEYQKEVFEDFDTNQYRFFLINWHRRARKCRAYDTGIHLADGSYHKVQEIIGKKFKVLSVNSCGDYIDCEATAENNGEHECFEVITFSGRRIIATGNHPLLTFFGWKEIQDLAVHEKVLVPSSIPIHGKKNINQDELKFIAYMIGDGSVSSGNCNFSQEDNHQLKEFRKVVTRLGGETKKISKYDYRVNGLRNILRKYDIYGKTSHHKEIPKEIFSLVDSQVGIFLSRLFSTDGWFNKRRQIGYCSVNRVMLEQIQLLLLRFGIFSTITSKTTKGFLAHQLNICSVEDVYRFGCEIGIYGKLDRKMLPKLFTDVVGYKYKSKIQRYSHFNKNFIYDSIKSIRNIGIRKTVAIEVPETQNYVHTFVEHNTTLAINLLIREASTIPNQRFGYITSTFIAAKNIIWRDPNMIKKYLPDALVKRKNESELYVEFNNGSILSIHGSDNPDSLRGVDFRGVVIDEWAFVDPVVWFEIIRPIIAQSRERWAMFIYTPNGRNHAYMMHVKNKDEPEWKHYTLDAETSQIIPQEELVKIKREIPAITYAQEFMCEYGDGSSGVFKGVDYCISGFMEKKKLGLSYVTGVDLAKIQDWTVLITICRETRHVVSFRRFNQIDWSVQKEMILDEVRAYDSMAVIDATGVGDPIYEDLSKAGVKARPFKINNANKKELIDRLSVSIEQRLITFPDITALIDELKVFSYELTPSHNIKYAAPQGMHDDCVISLALAVWGIRNFIYGKNIDPKKRARRRVFKKPQSNAGFSY